MTKKQMRIKRKRKFNILRALFLALILTGLVRYYGPHLGTFAEWVLYAAHGTFAGIVEILITAE